jgi:hypothetical protein
LFKYAILSLLLCLNVVATQAQNKTGLTLHGQVVDPSGSAIKAAKVSLGAGPQDARSASTDNEGQFVFNQVAAGRYRLTVTAAGFADYHDEVTVEAAQPNHLKLALSLLPVKGEVEISGQRGSLSTSTNANAIVLRGDLLKRLPRNEAQLRQLLERLAGGFAGRLNISVNGLAGASLPPVATIKEIRINNDPFSAAYHELGSARVEIETKGGTDLQQGSVYFNYRNGALDARNAFSLVRPPLEHRDVGGWWSSRLFNERSFVFALLERQAHEETIPVTAFLPEGQFNANLPKPNRDKLASVRVDFLPSDRHTISLLFNHSNGWQRGAELTSLDLPERSYDTRSTEQSLQAAWRMIASARLINEAQLRLVRTRSSNTTDNTAAAIEVAGAFSGGGAQCCPERFATERFALADNLTFSAGRHLLKAGIDFAGAHNSELTERDFGGTFYYASLSFYRLRRPQLYTVSAGAPRLGFGLWQFAAYWQDELRVKPSFTLSAGVRYETQTHLSDRNNWAPRVGFAWSPFKSQNTVVRGGAGIFYQQLEEGQLSQALRYDGARQRQIIILRPRQADPLGGQPLDSFPASINRLAADLRTPYQMHTALGIEQQLPHNLMLSAKYNYVRSVRLFRTRDINAPLPGSFVRPNPALGRIAQLESSSSATYHGLSVGFSQSFSERATLFGNYTLSRAIDDGPGAWPVDSYNVVAERGLAASDERHQFFFGASFALPYGLELSPLVYFNTGRPYNLTTGFDDNGDSVTNDRPTGVGRNTGRGPNFASVDLRAGKSFSFKRQGSDQQLFGIEIAAEATNLLNRVNLADFIGVQTSPFFGRANAAHNPRQVSLQITFYFH